MKHAKIIGTGSYLPAKVLTNADLEQMVETSAEWIVERTGILERHIVAANETSSDMAYQASLKAIAASGILPEQIDLIIVATSTPDSVFPSTACILQRKLGLKAIKGAFDLQAACTGFIYALATANCYIQSQMAQTILVVGVDTMSRVVDYTDRGTCILFGDGAGAVIVQAADSPGILGCDIRSDGNYGSILTCSGHLYNGSIQGSPYIKMDGQAVFKFAVRSLSNVATTLAKQLSIELSDIDWIIPHQANIRILEAMAKMLGCSMEKIIATVAEHSNTSAASIPLALDSAVQSAKVKSGDLLLLAGVGAGFSWGAIYLRY